MNITATLKEARELLSRHVEDDPLDPVYIELTDILVAATTMESDLMWANAMIDVLLSECDLHEGIKTQLEGFRNHYERSY